MDHIDTFVQRHGSILVGVATLMWNEMAVRKSLEYDKGLRSFVACVTDDVSKFRHNCSATSKVMLASHALVAMLRGLETSHSILSDW